MVSSQLISVSAAAGEEKKNASASAENPPSFGSNGMRLVSSMTDQEITKEKLRIWKNMLVISISFMFLFTAYQSMANLQVN